MTDEDRKAIQAKYQPLIDELKAKKDNVGLYMTLLTMGVEMASTYEPRVEAVEIEKVTRVSPQVSPITYSTVSSVVKGDEKVADKAKTAPPVISLPYVPLAIPPNSSSAIRATSQTTGLASSEKHAVIGRDLETGTDIAVGDIERCGGFYVLGQPRMGKSNLLISMALQDIKNGHGLLFIDPHTEAINKLIERIPKTRLKDVVYLDPTRNDRSFGINLLHCKDRKNPLELENTCGRVREIFAKVWGDERGELSVWLYKVITNSVYILLENEGFTLADVPLLLWKDTTFRNSLLKNVTTTSVWFVECRGRGEENYSDFEHGVIRFFCDLGVTDQFAYLFQIYNARLRNFQEFSGRDIMPLYIVELIRQVRNLFDYLVIATPYHDIASKDWGQIRWVRNVDPFLLGFVRQVPELVFFLGRWSGRALFPRIGDMIADTIDHLNEAKPLLANVSEGSWRWYKTETRVDFENTVVGPRLRPIENYGVPKQSLPRLKLERVEWRRKNHSLVRFAETVRGEFEEGNLFTWLRGDSDNIVNFR